MGDFDLNGLLEMAKNTAVSAGKLAREKFLQPRDLKMKGFRDIVTDADIASQKLITDAVLAQFPDHGFLTEEDDSTLPTEGDVKWVIDPIDGTTNYSRQIPEFSVSVGAVAGDENLVGAIYDPMREELFWAVKGQGAFLNGQRIRVSAVDELGSSIFSVDWSREPEGRANMFSKFQQVATHVQSARALGSAAIAQAWIAAGRLDGYLNLSLSPWDVAAGCLIVQEAGGFLSAGDGRPFNWQDTNTGVLVTNGRIHDLILGQIS